jgi:hypothetical protein
VTLVHGTWADTKGWVAPGSLLRRELEHGLADVVFREFPWTSANTHAARTEAGVRLAAFIRDGHAQYPEARHFMIAHSHGGNVALYAMRDPAAREVVAGIVTLATPFIRTRRRAFHRHVVSMASVLLAVPLISAFLMLDALSLQLLAIAWIIGAVFLIVRVEPALSKWLIDLGRREQHRIIAALQPPPIDPSRLLILRTRGDEASRWLKAWDVVARGPFVIAGVLLTLMEGMSRSKVYGTLDDITLLGMNGWTLASSLTVAGVIGSVALIFSGIIRWPGYWREPLSANLLVEIGTDETPKAAGTTPHTTYLFDAPSRSLLRGTRFGVHAALRWAGLAGQFSRVTRRDLLHTAICDNLAVVSAALDWISQGMRPEPK